MSRSRSRWDLEVTREDIAAAVENDSMRCVVSQTIARSIPGAHHIDVDVQAIRFTRGDDRLLYLTPYAVQGYIVAFDAGEEIQPFRFRIQSPQKIKRRKRTEAGKAILRAQNKVNRAAPRKRAQAKQELAAVRAAHKDEPKKTVEPGVRAPRRVVRTMTRSYGHRVLRVNQDRKD